MTTDTFAQIHTLDDVRQFIADGYLAAANPPMYNATRRERFGFTTGSLPLAISQPGPLIEHAVRLAGDTGLLLQEVRSLFSQLGARRLDEALAVARSAGLIREAHEKRP